jgi:hypothetical protein
MPGSTEKRPSARGVKATYRDSFERLVAIKNE